MKAADGVDDSDNSASCVALLLLFVSKSCGLESSSYNKCNELDMKSDAETASYEWAFCRDVRLASGR